MSFQQICRTYRQNIQQTREQDDTTAELSLHGHLKDFLEQTAVRYADGHVWINADQHFTDVVPEVWEYEIGAYQVCKKWLQDRKNTPLSHAEVRQYSRILVAIAQTLRITAEIDAVLDFQ